MIFQPQLSDEQMQILIKLTRRHTQELSAEKPMDLREVEKAEHLQGYLEAHYSCTLRKESQPS